MTLRLAAALAALSGAAAAEPVYFAAPRASIGARDAPGGAVVGLTPAGPGFLEAIELDPTGEWALVALPESGGWIPVAGLTRADPPRRADAPVPVGLRCVGTEPFWSVAFDAETVRHETPDGPEAQAALAVAPFSDPPAFPLALSFSGPSLDAVGVLRPQSCGDGMSDRPYGWALDLFPRGGGALSGCCLLPRGG
jgi:uncharacterized membrane protein